MGDTQLQTRAFLWARIAGLAYLAIIILGVFVEGFANPALIVEGDPAATAININAHELMFRGTSLAVLVLYSLVLVLSFALFEVLKSVDRSLALLGLLFRSAEGIIGCTTVLIGVVVAQLVLGDEALTFAPEHRRALAWVLLESRTVGMNIVLFLIGVGGPIYCYLFFKSRYIPRWLAAWGIGTYLSMLVLAALSLLAPDLPPWLKTVLFAFGTFFELTIGLWLLVKGIDLGRWKAISERGESTGQAVSENESGRSGDGA